MTGGRRPPGRLVAGVHPVREALVAGHPLDEVRLARDRRDERIEELRGLAHARGVALREVDRTSLDRDTPDVAHQGVVATGPAFPYVDLGDVLAVAGSMPLLVALDGVTDPHNLGAVARTAEALGADGLLLPRRRAAGVTAVAEKTAAGALSHLPVALVPNVVRALDTCREGELWRIGLDADGTEPLHRVAVRSEPVVLVVGAEGRGLARLTAERCDVLASIPLAGRVASLNASVAAAIALYEIVRARREDAAAG